MTNAWLGQLKDLYDRVSRPWTRGREPMEIERAVLDEIESRCIPAGHGVVVFPYDQMTVELLSGSAEERDILRTVVEQAWSLEPLLVERLQRRGAQVPEGLAVVLRHVVEANAEEEEEAPFRVHYRRIKPGRSRVKKVDPEPEAEEEASEVQSNPLLPALRLKVAKGEARRKSYRFEQGRIFVGRLDEVVDGVGVVKRRNDVAFSDDSEINDTVSREHARIDYDDSAAVYRLRDEGSATGTVLFRRGRRIPVSPTDRRGIELREGDEIYLGQTCLEVGLEPV